MIKQQLLRFTNVTLRLGKQTFGPFDINIDEGEHIAILGPSGAGKSTLLKLMAREFIPSAGEITLHSRALKCWSLVELSYQRAVLSQSHDVAFSLLTDLVIELGRVSRIHDPRLKLIVEQAAELARADHLLGRHFDTLSGGEKARVQIARVFAQLWDIEHALILVDEPLAALDPGLQFQLMDAILEFAQARQHAVVAILHDVNHALQGFERLLLVKSGKLISDEISSIAALPSLELLYEVKFASAVSDNGKFITSPIRKLSDIGRPSPRLDGNT